MGGSGSKAETPVSPNSQVTLLQLLTQATTQKENEYTEVLEKLNKKLEHVMTQKEKNEPNAAALLNLKCEKLKLKLIKHKEHYEMETKLASTIRQIHSDEKQKLDTLNHEKTVQLVDLNLNIDCLNVEIDILKRKHKDQEISNTKLVSTIRQTHSDEKQKLNTLDHEKTVQVASLNVEVDTIKQKLKDQEISYNKLVSTIRQTHSDEKQKLNTLDHEKTVQVASLNVEVDTIKQKLKDQEISYNKLESTICQIHSDQKQKLNTLDHEKTVQVADLNLNIDSLNVEVGIIKQKLKDEEISHNKLESTICQIHSDQTQKLNTLDHDKNVQVADLNLNINSLNVEVGTLKQKLKDQEISYNVKLQETELALYIQRNNVEQLKRKEETLNTLQSTNDNITGQLKSHEMIVVTVRASNAKLTNDQFKYKQEIMYLKTENTDLNKQNEENDAKCHEAIAKHNLEVEKNKDLAKEMHTLHILLINNFKLTTLQQRGIFIEIKKALEGLKTDLQYLIPHLSERTIPTFFQTNKEIEKLNGLMDMNQEKLNNVIACQSRFDKHISTKRSLVEIEKISNFLGGVELPCSFLHVKFLPLFRITFSMTEPQDRQNVHPKSILKESLGISQRYHQRRDNKGRGAYTKIFTQKNNPSDVDDAADFIRINPFNPRNRDQKNKNVDKSNQNQRYRAMATTSNANDDNVAENSPGITLTVLPSCDSTSDVTEKASSVVTKLNTDCLICFEPLRNNSHSLDCMHTYHLSCISVYGSNITRFRQHYECPECARNDD